jgi:hypothetical protein
MLKKILVVGLTSVAVAGAAQAAIVTTLPGGTALVIPPDNSNINVAGPVAFTGATPGSWTSSGLSLFGSSGSYSFGSNGSWSGTPMAGTNSPGFSMTFTFNAPISGFLGQINWAPENGPAATMQALSASGGVLETITFSTATSNILAPNGFWGFSRSAGDIKSIVLQNQYIGIRSITTVAASGGGVIPEPSTWMLMILGFGLIAQQLRRRTREVAAA